MLFVGKTSIFFEMKLFMWLAPFKEYESSYEYVHRALVQEWSNMLIWPFVILMWWIAELIRIKRGKNFWVRAKTR